MASPQCENGFIMIAVELFDALVRAKIPSDDMSVLLAIVRKTYGYKKKQDSIPISQIQKITGLRRSSVCRSLKRLIDRNFITSLRTETRKPSIYAPNKDWETWVDGQRGSFPSLRTETIASLHTETSLVSAQRLDLVSVQRLSKEKKKKLPKETIPKEKNLLSSCHSTPPQENGIPYREILESLNSKTGKNFKPTSKETKTLIQARWKSGFRLPDFLTVIDNKTSQWRNDPKMAGFLRPQTLFGTKFEAYLQETPQQWQGRLSEKGARSYQNLMRWAQEEETNA